MKSTLDQRFLLVLFLIFSVIILAQLAQSLYIAWGFTTDDAYISWRYAKHLVNGHGLRWNVESAPVEGYSNFSWVMLAALVIKIGLPVVFTMKAIAISCLLATLLCLYLFYRTFLPPLLSLMPLWIFTHYGGVIWWTTSGLETPLYTALTAFTCWQAATTFRFLKQKSQKSSLTYQWWRWLFACLGLLGLALTRFEGVIWAFVILGFILCMAWKFKPQTKQKEIVLGLTIFLVCYVVPYLIYFFWRLDYFGHLIPNSYACKIVSPQQSFYLTQNFIRIALPCLIFGLPHLLLKKFASQKDCYPILLWLPSVIYILMLFQANPVVGHYNRLFLAAFTTLTILPVLGAYTFFKSFEISSFKIQAFTVILMLFFTHFWIPKFNTIELKAAVKHYQQRSQIRHEVANFLNKNSNAGDKVLLADNGLIPFETKTNIHFIDSECLNNAKMRNLGRYRLYASYVKQKIMPEWAVITYYPQFKRSNSLAEQLQAQQFFYHYKPVKRFESHRFGVEKKAIYEKEPDFVYIIYKRTYKRMKSPGEKTLKSTLNCHA